MKGTRILLAIVCAAALAAVPAAAQSDGWDNFGGYDAEAPAADPAVEPPKETGGWDDGIWENWDGRTADPALAEPSEKQQELEQKQQELEQKQQEREQIIAEEKLKPAEAQRFVANAFRDGALKTTGTDIDQILPPVSRFGGGNRTEKKKTIIQRLAQFFEKYFGI